MRKKSNRSFIIFNFFGQKKNLKSHKPKEKNETKTPPKSYKHKIERNNGTWNSLQTQTLISADDQENEEKTNKSINTQQGSKQKKQTRLRSKKEKEDI